MATVLQAKAIIEAEDRTGAVFAKLGATIDSISAKASKISPMVDKLASPSAHRIGAITQVESAVSRATMSLAGFTAGLAGFAGAAATATASIHSAAQRLHEVERMKSAGMSGDEIGEARAKAAELHAQMPSLGTTDLLHMFRNQRSVVGGTEEVKEIIDDVAKLRVIAQANRPGEDVGEDLDKLVKGMEIRGATQNPQEFHRMMNGIAKGLNAFGDTLKPEQYYEMMKYGRQATPGLSEEFILSTAPTLAQELGGSSYGKAVSAFNAAMIGGVMKHSALGEFERLGLVAPEDLDRTKTGEAKGLKPGAHFKGWRLAQSNPNEYVKQYLVPAMQAHGITSREDVLAEIPRLYQNQMAGQMVGLLATQQSRINKDVALYRGAQGIESADRISREDPTVVWQGLKNSFESLGGTVFQGLVHDFSQPIFDFSQAVARFDAALQKPGTLLGNFKDQLSEGVSGLATDGSMLKRANDWLTWKHGGDVFGLGAHGAPAVNYNVVQAMNPRLSVPTSGLPLHRINNPWYDAQGHYMAGPMVPSLDFRKPENVKLEGSADIKVGVDITVAEEWIVGKIKEVVSAQGALRADTGRSMPEASPGAWRGD
jgi:hypothetical protein